MPLPLMIIAAVLLAGGIVVAVLLIPRENPHGRAILDAMPEDPARAMNELVAKANPGATEEGLRDLQTAIDLTQRWQRNLAWEPDGSIDQHQDVDLITRGPWPRVEHDSGAALIANLREQGAFDHLAAFASSPPVVFNWPEGVGLNATFAERLQFSGGCRALLRAAVAEMRLAAAEHRFDDFLNLTDGCLALGQSMAGRLLAIDLLVAFAHQQRTHSELRFILQEYPLDEPTLATLDRGLARRVVRPDWDATIDAERLFALATIHETIQLIGGPKPSQTKLAADIEEHQERARDLVKNWTLGDPSQDFAQTALQALDGFASSGDLFELSASTYQALARAAAELDLDARGTRAMVAIARYRLATGDLPESLDALVPAYLEEVPADPFADAPLRYRRTPDQAPGYILYSVGADRTDNNGAHNSEPGHWRAALTPGNDGTDYVLTSKRWSIESGLDNP